MDTAKMPTIIAIVAMLLVFGCAVQDVTKTQKSFSGAMEKEAMEKQDAVMEKIKGTADKRAGESGAAAEKNQSGMQGANTGFSYGGAKIAGSATPYIRFNQADYDRALGEGKAIYLYFYANWCPICIAERPNIISAFNEMKYENAIGFEVHFKDSETNSQDEEMARKFGIPYQHYTLIIGKGAKEAFRSASLLSQEEIMAQIGKASKS